MKLRIDLTGRKIGKLTVIEPIQNSNTKRILWRCVCDCGNEYITNTTQLNTGRCTQCTKCAHEITANARKVDLTGKKFGKLTVEEMLYNYKANRTYCKCKCDCGKENVIMSTSSLKRGNPSCGCGKKEAARKSCGKEIDGMKFGRLTILSTDWEHTPPMVTCKCDCGNIITVIKKDVQSGHTKSCGCLQREMTSKANTKDWTDYVTENGVKICKPFSKNKNGVWLWECECGICKNHFYELPARLINNHVKSCGCLKSSSPELLIKRILEEKHIKFTKEYVFKDCKNKDYLKFDFAILDQYDSVRYLIEYDGKQHYIPIEYFDGVEGYDERIKNDSIKNEYCKSNSIPLYRLPYYLSEQELIDNVINIINRRDCGTFMVT